MEGTSQVVLGSSDQRKVPASMSLLLKSEKIPALLYVGKGSEYRGLLLHLTVPSNGQETGSLSPVTSKVDGRQASFHHSHLSLCVCEEQQVCYYRECEVIGEWKSQGLERDSPSRQCRISWTFCLSWKQASSCTGMLEGGARLWHVLGHCGIRSKKKGDLYVFFDV